LGCLLECNEHTVILYYYEIKSVSLSGNPVPQETLILT